MFLYCPFAYLYMCSITSYIGRKNDQINRNNGTEVDQVLVIKKTIARQYCVLDNEVYI